MDVQTLHAFEAEIAKVVPGFQVRFKDESPFQRFLGRIMYAFNRDYLTKMTSTFPPHVYFPSRASYEANPLGSFTTMAHEVVHLMDSDGRRIWQVVSYGLPQAFCLPLFIAFGVLAGAHAWILAIPIVGILLGLLLGQKSLAAFIGLVSTSIISASILAVMTTGWTSLVLIGALLCLIPWPSPWRTAGEIRGYSMNVATLFWRLGLSDRFIIASGLQQIAIIKQFVGPTYYFMSWSTPSVVAKLSDTMARLRDGTILSDRPFRFVYDFLKAQNELRP